MVYKSEDKEKVNFNYYKKVCPLCDSVSFKFDKKGHVVYCVNCGLVVQASYDYTGGNKFILEFGLL